MKAKIALLPGDGIGPDVMQQAVAVLTSVCAAFDHSFTFVEKKIGGASIDAFGSPLTQETLDACLQADAVLLGAVGGPKWDSLVGEKRPEAGLLRLRKGINVYCNLRPLVIHPALCAASPLKPQIVEKGVDVLILRELTGDVYFGSHELDPDGLTACDAMRYNREEIERAAHMAFRMAGERKGRITSVDKANVLAVSRLWRETVTRVAADYPDIKLNHMYVDHCAMQLVRDPSQFDVILTGNLFGDILSDEAAAIAGSLGVMPSASLGDGKRGLYEPIHGSAPDIAGQDMANPLGMILSAAMLLRWSLGLDREADCVEAAVSNVLEAGWRTPDLAPCGMPRIGTQGIGQLVCDQIDLAGAIMG